MEQIIDSSTIYWIMTVGNLKIAAIILAIVVSLVTLFAADGAFDGAFGVILKFMLVVSLWVGAAMIPSTTTAAAMALSKLATYDNVAAISEPVKQEYKELKDILKKYLEKESK